jgi:6-phosphogluconolactonase
MPAGVRIFPDVSGLSLQAADATATTIADAIRLTGRCSLVLSGGSTPRTLYRLLASRFRDRIPWDKVHVFWADERYVPHHDAESNYGMAAETLLNHVPCPAANVHPMPTDRPDPDDAARDYEATLRDCLGSAPARFDLMLLGIGPEGHVASLFPGAPVLKERTRWVAAVTTPATPPRRLTLTPPALARSAHTYFLVEGSGKAAALQATLAEDADANSFPAAGVARAAGSVIWWVDREAAALLTV